MKILHIVPNCLREELLSPQDSLMIISHSMSKAGYRWLDSWKEVHPRRYIVVDPPVFESVEVGLDQYIATLTRIQPDYAIVPDVRGNAEETVKLFEKNVDAIRPHCIRGVIGVVHGTSIQEWLGAARTLIKMGANVLGVVEEAELLHPLGRLGLLSTLAQVFPVARLSGVHIHLLGLSEQPQELYWIERLHPNWVISVDTSKAFVWSRDYIELPMVPCVKMPSYPGRGDADFFNAPFSLDEKQKQAWYWNVATLEKWLAFSDWR